MDIKFDTTVKLTPDQIKDAIAEFVGKYHDGVVVFAKDVDLDVGIQYEDRNPGGSGYASLKGASVRIKPMGSYQER